MTVDDESRASQQVAGNVYRQGQVSSSPHHASTLFLITTKRLTGRSSSPCLHHYDLSKSPPKSRGVWRRV